MRKHSLLGLPTAGNRSRVYPCWQFREDGSTIPHLRDVLQVLATGSADPWTWALWLTSHSEDAHDGLSAAEWLDRGQSPGPILAGARADAGRWAA